MKKLLLSLLCAVGLSTVAYAQSGDFVVGLRMINATQFNQIGLGADVQCYVTDNIRIAPAFDIFFQKGDVNTWNINANAHYVFNVVDKFNLYPIAGLVYSHWSFAGHGVSRFGANIGAGAEYYFTNNWGMVGEIKYQLVEDYSQAMISLGVNYKF